MWTRPCLLLVIVACGKDAAGPAQQGSAKHAAPVPAIDAQPTAKAPTLDSARTFDDLATALAQTIPADARVVGFGELHSRTDRGEVRSSLAAFTEDAIPGLADKLSDLIVETWVVDQTCGKAAVEATAKVEMTMRRPQTTRSEIGELAKRARDAKIQPHAMKITCADYARVAPPGKDIDPEAMLTLTTRELDRIAGEALKKRDAEPTHRPWVALYGGALHNDRFPAAGVEDWSYAAKLDVATKGHYIEIDLIVPELAEADVGSQKEPWFPLVANVAKVTVWKRGERSFVVLLPRGGVAKP